MKITAIVSEYNPFHNGHKYLADKARENGATHVASIMGGNFLQRGNCAIADKYARARAAVLGGIDLVFELPQVYASASAERFASGAVETLDGCGCIDELCFGAECGDTETLKRTADIISGSGEVTELCREFLRQGFSHPRAMQAAVGQVLSGKRMNETDISEILGSPNNTLGIEYIRALNRIGSGIEPFAVKRVGAEHDSDITESHFASASAVRNMILRGDGSYSEFVPETTGDILEGCIKNGECPGEFENNERGVLAVLRRMTAEDLAEIPDVTEGLENRLVKAVRDNDSIADIISAVKCKRYTHARLSRIIACAYLGITKEISGLSPKYIRVLAFNGRGAEILKIMKKTAQLPVVMSPAKDRGKLDDEGKRLFEMDILSSDMYGLLTPKIQRCSKDYYRGAEKFF